MKLSFFWKGFIFTLAAILLVGGFIFVNRIVVGDSFNQEEAQHALYGLWLWRDIQTLNWDGFWYDTQRQLFWPFLHSWFLSFFFLIFGVGYGTARLMSLVIFVFSIILIYLLSSKMSKRAGPKIGMLSVVLALTSPLMLRFATENMLEGLGALLFLTAAYVYMVCEERKLILYYILLALLIGLSIYTNYLYAYLLLPAFLVATFSKLGSILVEVIRLSRKGEKAAMPFIWWAYKKMIAALVLFALAAVWFSFSFSRKIQLLMSAIFKYSGGVEVQGIWQILTYYPRVIIEDITFSPWLGIFLLVSLFLPLAASRFQGLNKLYIYVWTVVLLLTLTISAKTPQMIYIILPFIFIIFSAALFHVLELLQRKNLKLGILLILFIALPMVPSLPRAYGLLFAPRPTENLIQVMDYFQASLPRSAHIAAPLYLKHLNPEVIQFHFRDWKGSVLTDEQAPESELFEKGEFFLITVELDEDGFYKDEIINDSLYRWNSWLRKKTMSGDIRLHAAKRFNDIGVTALIYQKMRISSGR